MVITTYCFINKTIFFNNFVLICGGYYAKEKKSSPNQVKEFDQNNFREHMDFPSMLEKRSSFKVLCLKGEVYVFGGFNKEGRTKSVEKCSPVNKTWNKVTNIPSDRQYFCACAFIDNIYIFGGYEPGGCISSCLEFDAKLLKWKEVEKVHEAKQRAASSIFEENIVVCGGNSNVYGSNTAESYDAFSNTWTPMPSMIEGRSDHSLVRLKSKLFAIGGGASSNTNCEVLKLAICL